MQGLVLASNSKYRKELLQKLHLNFIARGSAIDETPLPGEPTDALAARLSEAKARRLAAEFPNHLIRGSDQGAVRDRQILGKPGNRVNAIRQLKAESGRIVTFYTGLFVLNTANDQYLSDIDICKVYFRKLDDSQIERYIDIDHPFDCAGSFKSEGYGITLFEKIEGQDPNALIGLPLIKLTRLLGQFGIKFP